MTCLGQAIVNGRVGDLDNIFINCFGHLSHVLNLYYLVLLLPGI